MATDTFTCSRCGQTSYYRDGSYLFGQQIVCARCYAAQAAPAAPAPTVPGMPPQGVPAAYPAPPMGYPGAPGPYATPPPGSNICGLLGFLSGLLAIGCILFVGVALRKHMPFFEKVVQEAQKGESAKPEVERMVKDWAERNPDVQGAVGIGFCGFPVFLLVGLILSIVGVCLSNVRKGMAIAGLILNGLLIVGPCALTCLGGAMGG